MTTNIEHIINKIIECGRLDSYSDLDKLFHDWSDYQSFLDEIHQKIKTESGGQSFHYYETFHRLADRYNFKDLLYLIKGLTIVENNIRHGGSVSPIIALYKKLVEKAGLFYLTTGDKQGIYFLMQSLEKSPNKDIEDLTHWILDKSDNIYLPFGISTLTSKKIPEIKKEVESWLERQKEIAQREKQEKIDKEHRDELRKQQAAKNIDNQIKKTDSEREYRDSLIDLSKSELLTKILNDKLRPVYYYYNELNEIDNLDSESIDILRLVICRFKDSETGKFKRLKDKLIYLTENKAHAGNTRYSQ